MKDREFKQLIEKLGDISQTEAKKVKSKSILCKVDLGVVELQVTMGLN